MPRKNKKSKSKSKDQEHEQEREHQEHHEKKLLADRLRQEQRGIRYYRLRGPGTPPWRDDQEYVYAGKTIIIVKVEGEEVLCRPEDLDQIEQESGYLNLEYLRTGFRLWTWWSMADNCLKWDDRE
jgi:hypothetical protein